MNTIIKIDKECTLIERQKDFAKYRGQNERWIERIEVKGSINRQEQLPDRCKNPLVGGVRLNLS